MPSNETSFKPGQSGNPKGRPKGSKNRSKLPRPQRVLLNSEDDMIQNLVALAKNNRTKLERDADIPASVQLSAINRVLELISEVKEILYEMDEDEDVTPSNSVSDFFSTKAK